jgi:hypothetical protein
MVVPFPSPTIPSAHRRRTSTSVWRFIVATEMRCGRIVGTSTRIVSTASIFTGVDVMCLSALRK